MPIQRLCEFCGGEFSVYPSQIGLRGLNTGRFCSRACAAKSRVGQAPFAANEARRGKQAHNNARIKIACANCGEQFSVAPCRVGRKYPIKCCSQACSYELKRVSKPSGYRRSNWSGQRLADHLGLAQQLLGRDAVRGKDVHHIDGNRLNNSPTNLIVLERGEHRSVHDFQWRHGSQFTAEMLKQLFPRAQWLADFVPATNSRSD